MIDSLNPRSASTNPEDLANDYVKCVEHLVTVCYPSAGTTPALIDDYLQKANGALESCHWEEAKQAAWEAAKLAYPQSHSV